MAEAKRREPVAQIPSGMGVANCLIRWFTYNVLFASIPITIAVAFRMLAGKFSWGAMSESPEFLFFAIMLDATALGDVHGVRPALRSESLYQVLHSALLLCAVVCAIFYGCLALEGIFGVASAVFRWRLLVLSICLDVVSLVLATAAEVLVAGIRG